MDRGIYMLDGVSSRVDAETGLRTFHLGSANWLTRTVTRVKNSCYCRCMAPILSSRNGKLLLAVTAASATGVLIGSAIIPADDASPFGNKSLGFCVGYLSGVAGCYCYAFYQDVVKPILAKPSYGSTYDDSGV